MDLGRLAKNISRRLFDASNDAAQAISASRIGHELLGVDVGARALNLSHRAMLVLSGGRLGHEFLGMKALELHVIGRKSGERRSVMLTAPIFEPGRKVVLVASKGGYDQHPQWYLNVAAASGVELTIDGVTSSWIARTATAAEKETLWPRIVEAYAGYQQYQERTDRDIPVVICTPAPQR